MLSRRLTRYAPTSIGCGFRRRRYNARSADSRAGPDSEAIVMARHVLSAVLLSCAILTLSRPAFAAKKTAKKETTTAVVEQVLRDESTRPTDRRDRLAETLERARNREPTTSLALAHWQAGFVRTGKEWRSYDAQTLSNADSEKLLLYREQRAKTPQ